LLSAFSFHREQFLDGRLESGSVSPCLLVKDAAVFADEVAAVGQITEICPGLVVHLVDDEGHLGIEIGDGLPREFYPFIEGPRLCDVLKALFARVWFAYVNGEEFNLSCVLVFELFNTTVLTAERRSRVAAKLEHHRQLRRQP